MRIMVTANFINILLDPILIFGMGPISALGVEGAAWATVCAQWFQGLAALYLLVKHRPPVLVRPLTRFPRFEVDSFFSKDRWTIGHSDGDGSSWIRGFRFHDRSL